MKLAPNGPTTMAAALKLRYENENSSVCVDKFLFMNVKQNGAETLPRRFNLTISYANMDCIRIEMAAHVSDIRNRHSTFL